MKESLTAKVNAPSRLHLGLHDCGYATSRVFGGLGVFIDGFSTEVSCEVSNKSSLSFKEGLQPSDRTIEEAEKLISRISDEIGRVAISIDKLAPEHKGFGSKTSLLLAIGQSAFLAYGNNTVECRSDIVRLSERGGTSGIGVNGFWSGGLIVDGGHKVGVGSQRQFLPSSRRRNGGVTPSVLIRQDMPDDWRVQLFYDEQSELIEGSKEIGLFKELMPLPVSDIYRSIAVTMHDLVPAVMESDIEYFSNAIKEINNVGMKKEEIALQSPSTINFLKDSWQNGLATGLTSFGPTVFSISDGSPERMSQADWIASEHGLTSLGVHKFNNKGAIFYDTTIF